ncbi:MAG: CCA tRNA nucleotidyltransferase [Thermoprotei archaeon]
MSSEGFDSVLAEVLTRIVPSSQEQDRIHSISSELVSRISVSSAFKVELEGSVAKGTWLAGSPELDVFLLFPVGTPLSDMQKVTLQVGSAVLRDQRMSYAEHPYVRGFYDGIPVDLVPCYEVKSPSEMVSGVDRTPFHTRYINSHLTPEQKNQARLLKAFLKGLRVYGAEIRVRGFSGYAAEVMVDRFGGFRPVLEAAQGWRLGQNLGWQGRPDVLGLPDPVDPSRNVAASVSKRSFSLFVAASGFMLRRPSPNYFFPSELPAKKKDSSGLLVVRISPKRPGQVDDVLWGEIWRTLEGLSSSLIRRGVPVWDASAYVESDLVYLFFELESIRLPGRELVYGPPVHMQESALRFTDKWLESSELLRGPWVQDGRWMVIRKKAKAVKDIVMEITREGAGLGDAFGFGPGEAEVAVGNSAFALSRSDGYKRALLQFSGKMESFLNS